MMTIETDLEMFRYFIRQVDSLYEYSQKNKENPNGAHAIAGWIDMWRHGLKYQLSLKEEENV